MGGFPRNPNIPDDTTHFFNESIMKKTLQYGVQPFIKMVRKLWQRTWQGNRDINSNNYSHFRGPVGITSRALPFNAGEANFSQIVRLLNL